MMALLRAGLLRWRRRPAQRSRVHSCRWCPTAQNAVAARPDCYRFPAAGIAITLSTVAPAGATKACKFGIPVGLTRLLIIRLVEPRQRLVIWSQALPLIAVPARSSAHTGQSAHRSVDRRAQRFVTSSEIATLQSSPTNGRCRTENPVEQRAIRLFAPAPPPRIPAKAIRSPASAQLPQHSRRRQIPIARCTVGAPHPAISCLGAFRTPALRA